MKEFLTKIVQEMVEFPDQIEISPINTGSFTIFELKVAKSDLGKIIGKKGRNVNALRNILSTVSARNGKRVSLDILD